MILDNKRRVYIESLAFQIYIFISKHPTITSSISFCLQTIILRQKHINRNTKRKVNIQSCNLTPLPLMDSLSLLSGSVHNPGWRFCHLFSLLPRASIINRWLVEVTGAASVGEKQVEVRGSSYHSEKNADRLSKAETAEKSGRDAEFRVAGRRSGVNKQRIKGDWKWQQQEWKGGMWEGGGGSGVGAKTNTLFVIAAVCRFLLTCHMQAVITCFHLRTASSGESGRWHHYSYPPKLCYFHSVRTLMAQTFSMTQQMFVKSQLTRHVRRLRKKRTDSLWQG